MSYIPPDPARWAASQAHQRRAHRAIPGGAHTYARGDDQMPEAMPVVIARGEGCRVVDLDGNRYVEYGMGLRAVTLGYAHADVSAAAREWIARGVGFSRPASVELEAAEAFLALVPGAERVKFCKDGSSATTAAVKLARAATGRDRVALCGDHPFLSQDDWFIGATAMPAGVPRAVRDLSLAFPYGDVAALHALFDAHAGEIACVILEPTRDAGDPSAYLRAVQALCRERGAVFVLDEMVTGFRLHAGGAQTRFGIVPDLSAWGKALANGFSASALAGRADLMDRGGLATEHERVFLLSSTHGAETHALAAAVATMRIYARGGVVEAMERAGTRLRAGVEAAAARHGVGAHVRVLGAPQNLVFTSLCPAGRPSQAYRTLLLQELARRGVLAPSLVVSAAHDAEWGDPAAVDETVEAFDGALAVYAQALGAGSAEPFGVGRPVQPVFRPHAGVVWTDGGPLADAPAPPQAAGSARVSATSADTRAALSFPDPILPVR